MTTTRQRVTAPFVLAILFSCLVGCAGQGAALAFDDAVSKDAGITEFALVSQAFNGGQPIPPRHSAYDDDVSPPLAWAAVEGAQSYALVMEDPDADRPAPYVHWVAWNIPADVTAIPGGLPKDAHLAAPDGMRQGLNDRGTAGYFGPRPPAGTGVHDYHLQLFALDTTLDIDADADRNALVRAMRGHVLGRARLVGTYAAPTAPEP